MRDMRFPTTSQEARRARPSPCKYLQRYQRTLVAPAATATDRPQQLRPLLLTQQRRTPMRLPRLPRLLRLQRLPRMLCLLRLPSAHRTKLFAPPPNPSLSSPSLSSPTPPPGPRSSGSPTTTATGRSSPSTPSTRRTGLRAIDSSKRNRIAHAQHPPLTQHLDVHLTGVADQECTRSQRSLNNDPRAPPLRTPSLHHVRVKRARKMGAREQVLEKGGAEEALTDTPTRKSGRTDRKGGGVPPS